MQKKLNQFLIGPNKLAHKIAQQVVYSLDTKYNPIVLCGPSGVGKTHLLGAINAGIETKFIHSNILFLHAEKFHENYVSALHQNQFQQFRKNCRDSHVFILDDIHTLQNKIQTQQELLFLINDLLQKNKLIVISSRLQLKKLTYIAPALINRLASGLCVAVSPISYKLTLEYCQKIASRFSFCISPKLIEFALDTHKGNFGEFIENFEKLLLFAKSNKIHITASLIAKFNSHQQISSITKEQILNEVVAYYKLENQENLREKGDRSVNEARSIAMVLVKNLLGINNQRVGKIFGGRSEGAIRHSINKVKNSEKLQKIYLQLHQKLESHDA